jgi:hypothetical protein
MGIIVFVVGLFVPALHLFDAVQRHEDLQRLYPSRTDIPGGPQEVKRVRRVLEHMLVFVGFRAITYVLEPLLGWSFIFNILEILVVAWLVGLITGWCYSGSHYVAERVLLPLASQFPFVVNYADDQYKGQRGIDLSAVLRKLWSVVRVEYDRIYSQITDDY